MNENETGARQNSERCKMLGCTYPAEYDGWCKWCAHHLDRERVEADHPDLEVLP